MDINEYYEDAADISWAIDILSRAVAHDRCDMMYLWNSITDLKDKIKNDIRKRQVKDGTWTHDKNLSS